MKEGVYYPETISISRRDFHRLNLKEESFTRSKLNSMEMDRQIRHDLRLLSERLFQDLQVSRMAKTTPSRLYCISIGRKMETEYYLTGLTV